MVYPDRSLAVISIRTNEYFNTGILQNYPYYPASGRGINNSYVYVRIRKNIFQISCPVRTRTLRSVSQSRPWKINIYDMARVDGTFVTLFRLNMKAFRSYYFHTPAHNRGGKNPRTLLLAADKKSTFFSITNRHGAFANRNCNNY